MTDTTTTDSGGAAPTATVTDTTAAATNATTATAPTTGEGQGEGNPAAKANNAPQGAPEAYANFALPEGYTLDGERLTDTTALFKELNLSQDQAQKLIDRYVKFDGENAQGLRALLDVERQQRIEKWGAELKEQLGNNYEATVADARAAVTWANDPALVEAFDAEGWGNHPALVAFFSKVGAAVRGDKLNGLGGETANRPEKTMAERIYPNMK